MNSYYKEKSINVSFIFYLNFGNIMKLNTQTFYLFLTIVFLFFALVAIEFLCHIDQIIILKIHLTNVLI